MSAGAKVNAGGLGGTVESLSAEIERLPHVDEHSATLTASPESVWVALADVVEKGFSLKGAGQIARVLGCTDFKVSGPRPLNRGSTFPGFHVAAAEQPSELALAGEHRFSRYALIFRLDDLGDNQTRLRAETRAEFPGIKGRLYRHLVIGTRAHVAVTRGVLRAVIRRARLTI